MDHQYPDHLDVDRLGVLVEVHQVQLHLHDDQLLEQTDCCLDVLALGPIQTDCCLDVDHLDVDLVQGEALRLALELPDQQALLVQAGPPPMVHLALVALPLEPASSPVRLLSEILLLLAQMELA